MVDKADSKKKTNAKSGNGEKSTSSIGKVPPALNPWVVLQTMLEAAEQVPQSTADVTVSPVRVIEESVEGAKKD